MATILGDKLKRPSDMDSDTTDLIHAWCLLLERFSSSVEVADVGRSLLADWGQPHRRHHNIDHLREVLAHIDELADNATDPDLVRLAGWYHDAVYDCRHDDEENSARRAENDLSALGLNSAYVREVARLVRLTADHNPSDADRNGETLCDSDLAILGENPDRYNQYTQAVRAEYAHLTNEDFLRGRSHVLQALLAAPRLFRTPDGYQRWEAAARTNLAAELRNITFEMRRSQ